MTSPGLANPATADSGAEDFHYLPVSEEMHNWECFVTTSGRAGYVPGERYPHLGHPSFYNFEWNSGRVLPEYMIVLITSGRGIYEVRKGETKTCVQGDVLQVVPGQWHRYRPVPNVGWTEVWIGLGGEYVHRLRQKKLAFTQPCVAMGDCYPAILDALLNVLRIVHQRANSNSPVLNGEALKIIALVCHAVHNALPKDPAVEGRDEQLGKALEYIWTNSHRDIHVADVAGATGMNSRSLERRFAMAHHCSVRQEIEWSRFFRARRLLRNTDLPIKEIAYTCGFTDPRRMFEVFRRREGMTPSEVREQA